MNGTLSKILIFAAGAAIGSAVTFKYVTAKYESIIEWVEDEEPLDEEVETESDTVVITHTKEKPDIFEYAKRVQGLNYTNYANIDKEKKEVNEMPKEKIFDDPYVISPEAFDTLDGYDTINLTYYADGVLADDTDEIVEDVDGTVGEDFADHIGDYEDDAVHIRNDRLQVDYEILVDLRRYSDIVE